MVGYDEDSGRGGKPTDREVGRGAGGVGRATGGALMRGYLKAAGVIHQCTRCWSLRDVVGEPGACPVCLKLLGVISTETRPLAFAGLSEDSLREVQLTVGAYVDR